MAVRIAPLTREDAEAVIREIRAFPIREGVQGQAAADLVALVEDILRLSQLASEIPEIGEIDINPLLVRPEGQGTVALGARVRLARVA